MMKIWNTSREVREKDLGENLFLFIFAKELDRNRVLRNGPWNFDKALVLLEEPNGNIAPSRMLLKFAEFWVQIHNVPLLGMTVQTGRQIGNCMGECIDVTQGQEGECMGRFLRVRVKMDITKPLKWGTKISLPSGQQERVDFRYERLPDFCYNCRRMGHIMGACTFVDDVVKSAKDNPYGSFLRVIHDSAKPWSTSPKRPSN
ncbi:uncharacterized protein At4g02000-like [Prunus avium]|uniref:Uncharacterized protein At4g02000-like n=1 Tax=Prunus avium TaxID=42229 RepID=A0A6P5RUR1_PRUAV|nr:uncharacterized protein At4g02000-like [Prunus avium]